MERNICRICTKTAGKNSQELFNQKYEVLLRQIMELTGVTLKNTKDLPQNMCKQCHIDLEEAYEFRDRCINAQKYFISTEYKEKVKRTKAKHAVEDEIVHAVKNEEKCMPEIQLKSEPLNDIDKDSIHGCANDGFNLMEECYEIEEHNNAEPGELELQINTKAKDKRSVQEEPETKTDEEPITTKRKITSRKKIIEKKTVYICDQCGNHFHSRQYFRTHLRRHIGDKRFRCEVCPNEFYTNLELQRHMRRHTGERPFACKFCDRRFSDYSTKVTHERTHTNERPYACKQCDKAFRTTSVLKNHLLVHTGERPFRCSICNSSFQTQRHLTVHNRSIIHKRNLENKE